MDTNTTNIDQSIETNTTSIITISTPTSTSTNNNDDSICFLKPKIYDLESVDCRNLIYKLEALESRVFKNVHIPTISQLKSINVCPRCILRFLNIKELSIYQESYETLSHLIQFILFNEKQKDLKESNNNSNNNNNNNNDNDNDNKTTETKNEESVVDKIEQVKKVEEMVIFKKYNPNLNFELKNFVCCCCLGILQETNDKELFLNEFLAKMRGCGYEFQNYSLALSVPISSTIRDQSVWYYLGESFPSVYKDEKDMDIVDIKEGVKWILGPIISRNLFFQFKPNSDFRGNMAIGHDETKDDHQFLVNIKAESRGGKRQKQSTKRIKVASNDSTSTVSDLLNSCSKKDFLSSGVVPPTTPSTKYQYQLSFKHEPVFLSGKYNKYVRDLSQTPWEYNDSSVQDIVCKDIQEMFKADSIVFTTSGREDIDVRMLGNGRPFYIEITNPHKIFFKNLDYEKLENSINESSKKVRVSNLQLITKKETNIIKDSGGTKQKNYRCVIWTSRALQPNDLDSLNAMKDIELKQNTPIRVLHRRTLMVRNKKISKLVATFISPHFFTLDIIDAQAGTYIKEFVHGDLGRTVPNIGLLLGNCEADILQLDVLNVDLDFPKPRK